MQKWRFIYRFSILFLDVFWEQHQSRFVLADDLQIILKFVAGHSTIDQPASINILFGCKQAQQDSRTHWLSFIRAVTWSAPNAESHWSHVHISLTVEHFSFHAFYVWVTARFNVLFKSLNVTRTTIIFLARFRFLKKLQIFLMLLGIMHAAPPQPKISIDILLPAAKALA